MRIFTHTLRNIVEKRPNFTPPHVSIIREKAAYFLARPYTSDKSVTSTSQSLQPQKSHTSPDLPQSHTRALKSAFRLRTAQYHCKATVFPSQNRLFTQKSKSLVSSALAFYILFSGYVLPPMMFSISSSALTKASSSFLITGQSHTRSVSVLATGFPFSSRSKYALASSYASSTIEIPIPA